MIPLKCVLDIKWLGLLLEESGTDGVECYRKLGSERRAVGIIRSLVLAKCLRLECIRILHKVFLLSVLIHGSKKMVGGEGKIYD